MFRIVFIFILLSAGSCHWDSKKADVGEEQEAAEKKGMAYSVDTSSRIEWAASKPTATHRGTFRISSGKLFVDHDTLSGGIITIDITSLTNVDLVNDPGNKAKLEGHLKSPDFFDIAKFPTATFEITSVTPYRGENKLSVTHIVNGNLTLKDSTKNVSFPATITTDARSVSASADFTIDRTQWGLNYKGPGNPENWFISKEVNLKLHLTAIK